MLFWTPYFSVLDSTFFILDSTFGWTPRPWCRFWWENVYGGGKYDVTVTTHYNRRDACSVDVTV